MAKMTVNLTQETKDLLEETIAHFKSESERHKNIVDWVCNLIDEYVPIENNPELLKAEIHAMLRVPYEH